MSVDENYQADDAINGIISLVTYQKLENYEENFHKLKWF